MSLANRIAAVRRDQGLSQLEFADRFRVSLSAYKSYEKGITEPPPSMLVGMVENYGLSARWLLIGKGKKLSRDEANRAVITYDIVEKISSDIGDQIATEKKRSIFSLVYEFSEENEINNHELIARLFKLSKKD